MKKFRTLCLTLTALISVLISNIHPAGAYNASSGYGMQPADKQKPKLSSTFGNLVKIESRRKGNVSQSAIKAIAPSLTNTLFIPMITVPDCGDVAGRVLQNGFPISNTYVSVYSLSNYFHYPSFFQSATTDAEGYFLISCVRSSGLGEEFALEVHGYPSIGQMERWVSNSFTLTHNMTFSFPPFEMQELRLLDPPDGSTIVLPYTFVWTSTYTNATSYSLVFDAWPSYSQLRGIQADTFTATVQPGPYSWPLPVGYRTMVRVHTPNGFGDSLNIIIRPTVQLALQ